MGILLLGTSPVILNFTETQAAAGFFGFFDTLTDTSKRVWYSHFSNQNLSDWTGVITGSSASMRVGNSGGTNQPFTISVDNGAWSQPVNSGTLTDGSIVLFSGLSDGPHTVRIAVYLSSGNAWSFTSGNLFTVTGSAPSVGFSDFGTRWMLTDPSFPGAHLVSTAAGPAGANVRPTFSTTDRTTDSYALGASLKVRAKCLSLYVFTGDTEVYYSIDGAAMVQGTLYDSAGSPAWKLIATGLDNTASHNYVIAPGYSPVDEAAAPPLGVMVGGSGATFSAIPTTKKVIQYGDSITYAANTSVPTAHQTTAVPDIYKVGAALGFIGVAAGKSGQTAAGLDADMATIFTYRGGVVENVSVIAIGRNDGGTASAAFKASVTSIVNKLLTAGVGKVLVRGTNFGIAAGARDTDLAAAVTAIGNANVVFIDVTSWTGINFPDGTHPDAAGYITMAGYATTAYTPYV